RVSDLLRDEISNLVRNELQDPRLAGLVTITDVDVSPDLRRADTYVSVLGSDEERASTMEALEHARPFIKRELSRRLKLRYTPDVRFVSDKSIERAQAVTDILRRTAAERGESL
ncbi:MAG: 30S ribosome-binding factor RbfA, partial [Dehalococcoidia bacterium]